MKKNRTILIITSIIFIYVLLNCIYIYHYYNEFTLINIINHVIVEINISINNLGSFLRIFSKEVITKDVIKLLIIVGTIIYITSKGTLFQNILEIIKSINSVELNGFRISMNKLEESIKEEDKKINELNQIDNLTIVEKEDKEKAQLKKKIFEVFIDSPGIAELINNTMNLRYKAFKINLRTISDNNLKYADINYIFNNEIKNGVLIVKDIRADKKEIVIEVFEELVSQGIIY